MIYKFLLFSLTCVNAFFYPTTKLASGKTISLIGNGPPILFSTGIYGVIPRFCYNDLIKNLKKNMTIVNIDGFSPINPSDIDDVANAIKTDKLTYVSHSSFDPIILESKRINGALLLDPISIPKITFNGIEGYSINLDYPVYVIKADKLYNANAPLPEWQNIELIGDVDYEIYEDVGHPDILDDRWANIAKNLGLWEMAEGETMSFKDWKFNGKNSIPKIRKKYREYVSQKISNLIFNI